MRTERDSQGFTLVELMVVVLVIAILMAIAVPTFLGARSRGQDSAARNSLDIAAKATLIAGGPTSASLSTSATELAAAEPALSFVSGTSTGPKSVSVAGDTTVAYLAVQAASGTCFRMTRTLSSVSSTSTTGDTCSAVAAAGPASSALATLVAGNGTYGTTGDGGAATSAALVNRPNGIARATDGTVYIAESTRGIRKIAADGTISTLVGAGQLSVPRSLAISPSGVLYVGEEDGCRVRSVSANGSLTVVAGTGNCGGSGTTGTAVSSAIGPVLGMTFDSSGNLYIAEDWPSCRVRKITPGGTISLFAGSGSCTFSGTDGAATSAGLNEPAGLAVHPDGTVYIAENGSSMLRKVGADGIIRAVAGYYGWTGNSGDGGLAIDAYLYHPVALAFDAGGNLYIADEGNHRIRKIDPTGYITRVAGLGNSGDSGIGGLATSAVFASPRGVVPTGDGGVLFTTANRVVRAG
ncbi:MAG: prepilin-type N-terminal cleavage/methylation domain-containing protein [Acidimicrobiia bacterium]